MAGTLFGLPLSQQMDDNGDPQSGCLLYIYAALTSTPADSYADSGLTTLNAFPMEADASGRIPQFWLADGSYRARLTTAGGVEIFDEDSILAIGPSVASTGGGGGGGSTDTTAVFGTGDMKFKAVTGTETGWVRCNARTIGSASSGATERASSDTQALFEFIWNTFDNTMCPVSTGRGGSALADFAANKAITTLDMRARLIFGLDDMGNSAYGLLFPNGTIAGGEGGVDAPNYHADAWTPAVAFGGSATGVTYTTQVGRYVRIDEYVTAWGTIALSNNGSGTGAMTITALPFIASSVTGLRFTGGVGQLFATNGVVGDNWGLSIAAGASVVDVYHGATGNNNMTTITNTDMPDTSSITFSVTYRTDDAASQGTGTGPANYRVGTWYMKL